FNSDRELAAKDMLPDIARRASLVDRLLQNTRRLLELAAQVDITGCGLYRIARKQHAFNQLVGVLLDDLAVFEGAGLGFVAIDHDVLRENIFWDKAPLQAGGEAGAA